MYERFSVGNFISEYRRKKDITLRQLGEITGLSYSYLSKLERDEISLPTKETLELLSIKLNLSYYHLLVAAGYVVNLETDIKTKDLGWELQELKDAIIKYRIYGIPNELKHRIEVEYKLSLTYISKELSIDVERLRDISASRKFATLEEAKKICLYFNVKFYEIFQIKKVNYDVVFMGMQDDEDVALQVHKYIEHERAVHGLQVVRDEIAAAMGKDNVVMDLQFNKDLKDKRIHLLEQIETIDEIDYLIGVLRVYKEMKNVVFKIRG